MYKLNVLCVSHSFWFETRWCLLLCLFGVVVFLYVLGCVLSLFEYGCIVLCCCVFLCVLCDKYYFVILSYVMCV